MNKKELIRQTAVLLRENQIRKSVPSPKHVFHISDDAGNHKDFVVKETDRSVIYTAEDIERILDGLIFTMEESLKSGEPINIQGFGSLRLLYRNFGQKKHVTTGQWVEAESRYIPKFYPGKDLKISAKFYTQKVKEDPDFAAAVADYDTDEEKYGGDE